MSKKIDVSAAKLVDLIEGRYDEVTVSSWGMGEYDDYERKYLIDLSNDDKVQVFYTAYMSFTSDNIVSNIKRLFYLASCFNVKFSVMYLDIIRTESNEEKLRAFFNKAHYYIDDRWTESDKDLLSKEDKKLMNNLCSKYGLSLLF